MSNKPGKIYYSLNNFKPHKSNYGTGVSYGRFQVYHGGHELATKMILNLGLVPHIVTSHTHKLPNNPMSPVEKIEFINAAWTGTKTPVIVRATSKNLSYIGSFIRNKILPNVKNGKKIVVFLGENRVRPSNGANKKFYLSNGLVNMGFNVVRSGKRVEGAANVTGLSSSLMRKHAVAGNYPSFNSGLVKQVRGTKLAREYFNKLHNRLQPNTASPKKKKKKNSPPNSPKTGTRRSARR